MSTFGDSVDIIYDKIKASNDDNRLEQDLELIFDCFEIFYDVENIYDLLNTIQPNVEKTGNKTAINFIKNKLEYYGSFFD